MAGAPAKVIIVEPYDELRGLNDHALRLAGYAVSLLCDARDLVACAQTIQPDVIVIGLGTTACVDLQVVDDLHRNPNTATIPVVAYSLLREREVTLLTRTPGWVTLIAPYSIKALWNGVARALGEPPSSTPSS